MKTLDGVLVVAVEQAVAAPLCTSRLADAGARVIKVERAEGDFARGYDTAAKGEASYFVWLNQGKESVSLDFRQPEDAALLAGMISRADVFVQNLAPGAAGRAGFDSASLRARHPRLITCDISGYGPAPEVADLKAYDLLVQAESGLASISGGASEMGRIGVSICDIGAGLTAHSAILEALIRRGRTGVGEGVEVSLFDVTADRMTVPLLHTEYGAGPPLRQGLRHPSIAPYGAYASSDGALTLISIQNEREWLRLCTALGDTPLASDPRFVSNTLRVANRPALEDALGVLMAQYDATELRERLGRAAIAFGAVNDMHGLAVHPALRRRTLGTGDGALVQTPALPVRHSAEAPESQRRSPVPGEHSEALRREFSA